ncbi:MAG TPA: hypothetical protein VIU93_06540 [Gallionellaceae bacterium]
MNRFIAVTALALLAACQSTPSLEEDARYVKLARVVDVHEYTDAERQQAKAGSTHGSVSVGVGVGIGSGSFSGGMFGISGMLGEHHDSRDEPPQVSRGANRYTVQPLASKERIEVMSYERHKLGDCVKVLAGHPSEYPRFFELKAGERCE